MSADRCLTPELFAASPEPPEPSDAVSALEQAWAELAVRSVGALSLNEVRDRVTRLMLEAALAQVDHNYSRAAGLLCVTRQSVQYLVARHELDSHRDCPGSEPRHAQPRPSPLARTTRLERRGSS